MCQKGAATGIDVSDSVTCNVYVGLDDEEALWLATRHNSNGHFHHAMTHREYVSNMYMMSIIFQLYGTQKNQI